MDPELKAYLEGFNSDLASVKSDLASVKSDLASVKSDIATVKSDIAAVRSDLANFKLDVDERFESMERRLKDHIETVETRLLTEFWKWARIVDQRLRRLDLSDSTTVERLSGIEERIFTLERKVGGGK